MFKDTSTQLSLEPNIYHMWQSGNYFMELNWAHSGTNCPATESICLLDEAGYRFANPADCTRWQKAGSWLRSVSDLIARKI
jgi:hypothetical protein